MAELALTVYAVAVRLMVSADTVRRWSDAGLLASFRLPSGHRRFLHKDVEAFRRAMQQREAD